MKTQHIIAAVTLICGCATNNVATMSPRDLMESAEQHERTNRPVEAAAAYQMIITKYPSSEFGAQAYRKLLDLHIRTKNWREADALMTTINSEYGGGPFYDSFLLKWTLVLCWLPDYPRALGLCKQLILEYPDSQFAATARDILPKIEEQVMRTHNKKGPHNRLENIDTNAPNSQP